MYHKSSQISLVVDTDTWTSANLLQYDEYFDHPWLCYIQFCRNFQVGKNMLNTDPLDWKHSRKKKILFYSSAAIKGAPKVSEETFPLKNRKQGTIRMDNSLL